MTISRKKVSSSPPQNMTRAVVMRNAFDQGWWQQRWLHVSAHTAVGKCWKAILLHLTTGRKLVSIWHLQAEEKLWKLLTTTLQSASPSITLRGPKVDWPGFMNHWLLHDYLTLKKCPARLPKIWPGQLLWQQRWLHDQGYWWQQRWLHDLAPERHLYPPGTSYLWRNCGDTSLQVHVAGPYQATPWYRHVVFTDELETKREKAMEKNRNWKGCTYVYDSIKLAPNKRETSATMGETKITAYIHEVEKMHAALPRSISWNPARSQQQQAAEKMLRYDLWLLKT